MALDSGRWILKIELVITALVAYYFTSLIVLLGLMFGHAIIPGPFPLRGDANLER